MLAKVIKPFAFYADGITPENLNVGDERDFGTSTEGLVKEGYVVLPNVAPVADPAPATDEQQAVADDPAADTEEAPRRGRPRKS